MQPIPNPSKQAVITRRKDETRRVSHCAGTEFSAGNNRGMDQPTGTRVGECKAGPPKPQPALNASYLCIFPRLIKALRPVAAPIFLKQVSGDDLEKVHFIRSRAFLHKPLF